jgi:hypothetical protein
MNSKGIVGGEKSFTIIFLQCLLLFIILLSCVFLINFMFRGETTENILCDYDSCSQESSNWNYTGSACFDSGNLDCQDFLRFWDACQTYKQRIGVC